MALDRVQYEPVWAGESVEIPFGLGGIESLDGWECRIQLVENGGIEVLSGVDRQVTDLNDDGDRFVVLLTGDEMALSEGLYRAVARLSEDSTGRVKFVVQGLRVVGSGYVVSGS